MLKIGQKTTEIDPKISKIRQIDQKISKKCVNYHKIPTPDKKCGTYPQNPTAGIQTYWALGNVPSRATISSSVYSLKLTKFTNSMPPP